MISARDLAAINGVENTPLLPSYYTMNYGSQKTKKHSKFGQPEARTIAKKLNLKTTTGGKSLTLDKLIGKIDTSMKSKTKQEQCKGTLEQIAKRVHVSLSKGGKRKSAPKLWTDIKKTVDTSKVVKKKKIPSKKSGSTVHQGRSRRKPQSEFGSWWDNTQKTYCLGGQCSYADQVGSGLPYYGNWKPYSSIEWTCVW